MQHPGAQLFDPDAVRLLDGPFKQAQDADVRYVLALDADRLCAPYLREAGLPPRAPAYGNWEGDGLGGHIGGHHLSACAQLWAATGDERLRQRLEHVLDEFERCQRAVGTGFLGGVPGGRALGEELAAGKVDADTFSLNGRWVPLYNLHKTLAGLLHAATHARSERALRMAAGLGDWWLSVSRHLDAAAFEEILTTEFGGMTASFAELAALTGREEFLHEAQRFAHRALLDPLGEGCDPLDGLHANTQIAKVVGYARVAAHTGDPRYLRAALHFWQVVTGRRTVAIGGNSVREHFHPADDFGPVLLDRQGPETCNTANMLELTALLFALTGDPALLDFHERATLNHVLSSQHPGRGGFVYFTSMRPAHYRVYSQPDTSMWCCVGSGMENHARYGRLVFTRSGADLAVNLYLAAALEWPEHGLAVRLEADLLRSDTAELHVRAAGSWEGAVLLRRPGWASSVDVAVDGRPAEVEEAGGYLRLHRRWSGSHVVTVRLGAGLAVEELPDSSPWGAYRWGPVVLAARQGGERLDGLLAGEERMGHDAAGPVRPIGDTPVVAGEDPLGAAVLRSRDPLRVELAVDPAGGAPAAVVLEPFATLHDERYTVYWPLGEAGRAARDRLAAAEGAADDVVVDEVAAGEQQPESDHGFAGEHTRARLRGAAHSRSATGWFSYALRDPEGTGSLLRLTFAAPDPADPRAHELSLGGVVLGEPVASTPEGDLVHLDHRVEAAHRGGPGGRLVLVVRARDGLPTGDLVRVRLLGGAG
ncbi:beta-L-arabinofuranosidase domain-containing protein [Kineococcus glutinatus]|uniref:Glycoside hydrolase family 127 protein n=1 Tax=Kineococcus glutinatus TaxID=1070872 RepID=A0ABP8VHR2_9ACTN